MCLEELRWSERRRERVLSAPFFDEIDDSVCCYDCRTDCGKPSKEKRKPAAGKPWTGLFQRGKIEVKSLPFLITDEAALQLRYQRAPGKDSPGYSLLRQVPCQAISED